MEPPAATLNEPTAVPDVERLAHRLRRLARDAIMRIKPFVCFFVFCCFPKKHQQRIQSDDVEGKHRMEPPAATLNEPTAVPDIGRLDSSCSWVEAAEIEDMSRVIHKKLAHRKMEEQEVLRMEEDQRCLETSDVVGQMLRQGSELAKHAAAFECRAQIRRKALEAKAEALAAREATFRRREAELAEQQARVARETEALQGNTAALEDLYRREKRRQAEEFAVESARLCKEHVAELAKLQEQFFEATRQGEQEMLAAMDARRELERALQETVGVRDAEAECWQREFRAREEQTAFERESLAAQASQLVRMQAELDQKGQLLEEKDEQLQRDGRAHAQLLAEGALSQEVLGTQRHGQRRVPLHTIRFSQDSIKATFRDGRSTEQTTRDLRERRVQPTDLGAIRVVELFQCIWTLDNRRVRCMKDAFAQDRARHLDVQVESLADAAVLEEFRRKFTAGKSIFVRR
eukprot:NODE_8508_length_1490_cov_8.250183.p1 GENE.NODE_8508_length_1490_cov_8.250183~~NODE_8508_length_1490_cov_8.250183.p1  ORF type:complete len:462 (+),score=123.89 NODE_8508_length_1490_cov_8.250183:3-1388(+)